MRRTAVGVSLVLAIALAITGPANAASDFDPDDVEGPLDLRWVGAWLTQDGEFRITIAFYDGFRVSALPTVRHSSLRGRGQVSVDLTGYITGLYVRRHGRIDLPLRRLRLKLRARLPAWVPPSTGETIVGQRPQSFAMPPSVMVRI